MSVLTKQERDGLEDIFLSIHINKKNQKLEKILILITSRNISFLASNLLKKTKYKLKRLKFSNFYTHLTKQKKNLSK